MDDGDMTWVLLRAAAELGCSLETRGVMHPPGTTEVLELRPGTTPMWENGADIENFEIPEVFEFEIVAFESDMELYRFFNGLKGHSGRWLSVLVAYDKESDTLHWARPW